MEIKLTTQTEVVYTRKFKVELSEDQKLKHTLGLQEQNKVFNYVLKYLERTFGYKHLTRPYPLKTIQKQMLSDKLRKMYMQEFYQKNRWDERLTHLHSQAFNELVTTLITNFGEYLKELRNLSKLTDEQKQAYKVKTGRSWYTKGSLSYMGGSKTTKTITLPSNNTAKIVSKHKIKTPWFSTITVKDNLNKYKKEHLCLVKLKKVTETIYELHLVFKKKTDRVEPIVKKGADWGMSNNKIWHLTDNTEVIFDSGVLKRVYDLTDTIKKRKSELDRLTHIKKTSKRYLRLKDKLRKLEVKQKNTLVNYYRNLAVGMFNETDLLVVEDLSLKDMRREKSRNPQTRGFNSKLSIIQPYAQVQILKQRANRLGKTLVLVDSYKTTQVEYGTLNIYKPSLSERQWISEYSGELIDRDLNASRNILEWGLEPSKHYKLVDYPNINKKYLVVTN